MENFKKDLGFYPEPLLSFGYDQCLEHPKDGLTVFGPIVDERKPGEMRVGVIGTPEGLSKYRDWVERITRYIPPFQAGSPNHTAFPGFEAAFRTRWPTQPVIEIPISAADISRVIRIADRHVAIYETVSLFANPIKERYHEDDLPIDIWYVVIPEEVYLLGRPHSRVPYTERVEVNSRINRRIAQRFMREPSLFAEDMAAAETYKYEINFHHQLKARLLEVQAVIQIVRDTSLDLNLPSAPVRRRVQDPATLAWNLCTASFFKAGGRPWRIANVRKGVCYVGLVFKKFSMLETASNACCGAQMFLDSGDGLVFKGAVGPWYSPLTREFHLPADEAAALVRTVVKSYRDIHRHPPHELFIHGRTRFDDAEWAGFRSGVSDETNLVGVRITRSQDMKLFRPGTRPVLRGTAYRLNRSRALLWTIGYIPRLQTYPGREVPNPLSIEICRGDADLSIVLEDVLRLTKVNFNTCIFADGLPVTLRFADAVGEILTAAPKTDGPPLPFRHYI